MSKRNIDGMGRNARKVSRNSNRRKEAERQKNHKRDKYRMRKQVAEHHAKMAEKEAK
jgi:hypothetical protein